MRKITLWSVSLCFAAMAAAAVAPALADDGPKVEEKRKVIVIDKDGERKVFEGDGPMVRRGYLGVELVDLTPELRRHFGAAEGSGVMVSRVESGSPADKAGVEVGDIITAIDGKAASSSHDIRSRMRSADEGEKVAIEFRRNNRAQNVTATVALRERSEFDFGPMFVGKDGNHMMLRLPEDLKGLPGIGEDKQVRIIHRGPRGEHGPHAGREEALEKQIEKLEKRIQELEQKLNN